MEKVAARPVQGQRVDRVFAALEQIVTADGGMTLTELADSLKISPSSMHDLLKSMVRAGVLEFQPSRRYTAGARQVALAAATVDALDARTLALGPMKELSKRIVEDVYLAVLTGTSVVYVARYDGQAPLTVNVQLGQPRPLHASSVGKLFAVYSDSVRERLLDRQVVLPTYTPKTITDRAELTHQLELFREIGMSISDEEAIVGVIGFAVPVFDSVGDMVAAFHVSLPKPRLNPEHVVRIIAEMFEAARETTVASGGTSDGVAHFAAPRALLYLGLAS